MPARDAFAVIHGNPASASAELDYDRFDGEVDEAHGYPDMRHMQEGRSTDYPEPGGYIADMSKFRGRRIRPSR